MNAGEMSVALPDVGHGVTSIIRRRCYGSTNNVRAENHHNGAERFYF